MVITKQMAGDVHKNLKTMMKSLSTLAKKFYFGKLELKLLITGHCAICLKRN